MPTLAGAYLHAHSLIKSTYTLNLFSVFHYLALMYKSDPPQCCYYISIFANIWYLIKLIHSITIILRVFMFYKQRVLANVWGCVGSAAVHVSALSWQTFEVEKTARFVPVASAAVTISLFGTYVQVGPTSMLLLYQYFLPTFDTWLN